MSIKSRICLVGLWALSLVAAAQFGAAAQKDAPKIGVELRFIHTDRGPNGIAQGHLTAYVNGNWVPVEVVAPKLAGAPAR